LSSAVYSPQDTDRTQTMNDRVVKDRERSDRIMIVPKTFKPRVRTIGSGWVGLTLGLELGLVGLGLGLVLELGLGLGLGIDLA